MTPELVVDTSAWARRRHHALPAERFEWFADELTAGRMAACLPLMLEAGYSARNARDHGDLLDEFETLPVLHIDRLVEHRALDAQRQLARAGHQRVPPIDLIVAALADLHGVGVLHYDGHYETILERTDLRFKSVWLAPRGSL